MGSMSLYQNNYLLNEALKQIEFSIREQIAQEIEGTDVESGVHYDCRVAVMQTKYALASIARGNK